MSTMFNDLKTRLAELQKIQYSPTLKTEIEKFIADVPEIKDDTSRANKVLIYILRAKALLLLPSYSSEAEADLNRALKMDPSSSADTYVALSECLWRKNQEEEAIDAVQSALEIEPTHVAALCQMSRLVRALASKEGGKTVEQKADLLQQSVSRAKEALKADISSGEAWSALGLAHIQIAVNTGFGYQTVKKALSAMQQAVAKNSADPDVHYNYAVVLEATGDYAKAAVEYDLAASIDPMLKGANKSAENCRTTIERHVQCQREAANNEALKKELLLKLPSGKFSPSGVTAVPTLAELTALPPTSTTTTTANNKNNSNNNNTKNGHAISLMVVGLISPNGVYPLCYHCLDRDAASCMLLVPRLQNAAISKRDVVTVTVPPCSVAQIEQKDVRVVQSSSGKQQKGTSSSSSPPSVATVPSFFSTVVAADPDAVMVNSVPIPEKAYVSPALSSRLFQ